ncbi:protein lethal(2)essential for life-like [Ostrinia furnacalis]|uniref:protein lethal(2)essential for life-like n=1 Tax=Ostrinia furnacalis TaxID=93504 RepID=UPI00103918E2|nr:protein lethal(2)essential for life-like [Ostrinia furnacalis]
MSLLPLFDERLFMSPMMRDPWSADFRNFSPILAQRDALFKPWHRMMRSWEKIMEPIDQLMAQMNECRLSDSVRSDDETFQVNVDVQHFLPEEISVKVLNKQVIVEGKHEDKLDDHGYVSRQFMRRYALPDGCLPDTVQSKLSSDGVLTITAPKVIAMPSTGERIIPITHTGPVQKQLGSPDFEE